MDFTLTPDQEAFRDRVRSWLATNIPREWKERLSSSADLPRPDAYELLRGWQRKMYEAGLVGLTWPRWARAR